MFLFFYSITLPSKSPTKSKTNSSENEKRTPPLSASSGLFLTKTKSQPNNLVISWSVPHFHAFIESVFPRRKSNSNSFLSDVAILNFLKLLLSLISLQWISSSDSDLSYKNATNTEIIAWSFSLFSRPRHPAGYQDTQKKFGLLSPKKCNPHLFSYQWINPVQFHEYIWT